MINLGSSFEISIGDTARTIAKLMSAELMILTDEQRPRPDKSKVERLWPEAASPWDCSVGSRPTGGLEGFRRRLAETVTWFTQGANLTVYKADRYNL